MDNQKSLINPTALINTLLNMDAIKRPYMSCFGGHVAGFTLLGSPELFNTLPVAAAELSRLYSENEALRQDIKQAEQNGPVAFESFKGWMGREMPPATIIENPEWWAKRIYDRFKNTAPTQIKPLTDDSQRLEWLMHCISGAEFRRIGVHYDANVTRDDIDKAIEAAHGIGGEA